MAKNENKAISTFKVERVEGKSPIAWFGGKFYLARSIIPLFPEHHCYCEVFAGSAQILFQKSKSIVEVLNDKNDELVNFFYVLTEKPEYFTKRAKVTPFARTVFNDYINTDVSSLSKEERAWRFFYINRTSFSGLRQHESLTPSFSASNTRNKAERLQKIVANIDFFSKRLINITIENLDYEKCIKIYDTKNTFFYIDPPYVGHEEDYGKNLFKKEDFANLAKILSNIKGKFLLSINDCRFSRKIFKNFNMKTIDVTYSVSNHGNNVKNKEILFSNYQLEKPTLLGK